MKTGDNLKILEISETWELEEEEKAAKNEKKILDFQFLIVENLFHSVWYCSTAVDLNLYMGFQQNITFLDFSTL